jgi:hypothetical protein
MSPLKQAQSTVPQCEALAATAPREHTQDAALAAALQARLSHLFRHAGAAPDNRFLQDLVTRYRKQAAT